MIRHARHAKFPPLLIGWYAFLLAGLGNDDMERFYFSERYDRVIRLFLNRARFTR